jgi:hypothetical protein
VLQISIFATFILARPVEPRESRAALNQLAREEFDAGTYEGVSIPHTGTDE